MTDTKFLESAITERIAAAQIVLDEAYREGFRPSIEKAEFLALDESTQIELCLDALDALGLVIHDNQHPAPFDLGEARR